MSAFWDTIKTQLEELKTARTAAEVVKILNNSNRGSAEISEYLGDRDGSADAFFAGGGGDENVIDVLRWDNPHWVAIDVRDTYYGCVRSTADGSYLTYIEGDVYAADRMEQPA
jgi:hypothetical protein